MRAIASLALAAAFCLPLACDSDTVVNLPADAALSEGPVRVTLVVTPAIIESPDTAVATLQYENTSSYPVLLTSNYGCVSFAGVYNGSTRVPFPSTEYACTAAITNVRLDPGVPLIVRWPLAIGPNGGTVVSPGTYRFVARLNTHADSLVESFVVR